MALNWKSYNPGDFYDEIMLGPGKAAQSPLVLW